MHRQSASSIHCQHMQSLWWFKTFPVPADRACVVHSCTDAHTCTHYTTTVLQCEWDGTVLLKVWHVNMLSASAGTLPGCFVCYVSLPFALIIKLINCINPTTCTFKGLCLCICNRNVTLFTNNGSSVCSWICVLIFFLQSMFDNLVQLSHLCMFRTKPFQDCISNQIKIPLPFPSEPVYLWDVPNRCFWSLPQLSQFCFTVSVPTYF